ncbi:hypothetical protein [Chitinilyticum aquatile]|uniref:hypothetical protein n=1 Tax=Chitinilyticum aquatile TaxID=362520 RepID=UPI00048C7C49|nr:hypothetical protein [Chitinilyticum aquatile]
MRGNQEKRRVNACMRRCIATEGAAWPVDTGASHQSAFAPALSSLEFLPGVFRAATTSFIWLRRSIGIRCDALTKNNSEGGDFSSAFFYFRQ